jgi:cellulose synthase/poly-beta-1,6-N-acetylglucosamine synthase-like glycosyltransferase
VGRAVNSLLAGNAGLAVFVVAHNCTDKTREMATHAGARVVALDDVESRGKAAALRHGFAAAAAAGFDAFLVVDADSVASANLVEETRLALRRGAAATQCRYEQRAAEGRRPTQAGRLSLLAFRGMNVLRARGRAAFGFSAGIFGNGFALTAETLGRVPYENNGITEDVEYHARLVAAGLRVTWLDGTHVFADLAAAGATQVRQQARWEGGRLHVAKSATPLLLKALLRGRLRAAETLLDVWSLPLSRALAAAVLCFAVGLNWLNVYAECCAGVLVLYLIGSVLLGEEPGKDVGALIGAPLFVLRRLAQSGKMLRHAGKSAEWVRTSRETTRP